MNKMTLGAALISLSVGPAFAGEAVQTQQHQLPLSQQQIQPEEIKKLNVEVEALKVEIKNLRSQTEAISAQQENNASSAMSGDAENRASGATLWGYGEVNYTRPKDNSQTQMDLRRAVFGIGYKFDSTTRFVSEYEIEHAIASADDEGEVEVEQFYIDHQLSESTHIKVGLFLIPSGSRWN